MKSPLETGMRWKQASFAHEKAPIYEALCRYEQSERTSMHVPGHKDGRVFDAAGYDHFSSILKIDATESVGIDDLHYPTDFIRDGQQLAADAFGADHTFFLVGGSTIGNLGIALSVCSPGDKILVQRNMHKSVFHGLLMAGAHPVYVAPAIESETKVAMVSDVEYLKQGLKEHPDVKGVWITNPNYYGMSQDVRELAKACHAKHIPLIVDEAHGAHFGQAEELPDSALAQGADLVVQSTHKMLTSLGMSSMLHLQGSIISRSHVAKILGMIQSTSPSYPMLASLDLARRYLVQEGRAQIKETANRLETERSVLANRLTCLQIWEGSEEVHQRDPLKWIISCRDEKVTGYQLLELFYQAGCTAEISDPRNIVFLFSLNEKKEDIERVVRVIEEIDKKLSTEDLSVGEKQPSLMLFAAEGVIEQPEITLQQAFHMQKEQILLADAVGRICGETILPYPPGIPLLTPGERITESHVDAIRELHQMGAYFQNPSDETMATIFVVQS